MMILDNSSNGNNNVLQSPPSWSFHPKKSSNPPAKKCGRIFGLLMLYTMASLMLNVKSMHKKQKQQQMSNKGQYENNSSSSSSSSSLSLTFTQNLSQVITMNANTTSPPLHEQNNEYILQKIKSSNNTSNTKQSVVVADGFNHQSSKKYNYLNNNHNQKPLQQFQNQQPQNFRRKFFFVHVGKAGGETIRHTLKVSCLLRRDRAQKKSCYKEINSQQPQETALSKYTIGEMHCQLNAPKSAMSRATTFLWTIRNPITRVISWYYYSHPINCAARYGIATEHKCTKRYHNKPETWQFQFYHYCFPSNFSQFIQALNDPNYKPTTTTTTTNLTIPHYGIMNIDCHKLALDAIHGKIQLADHLFYNYQKYWKRSVQRYPNHEIWAVRTEWLWQDLQDIEYTLGGNNNATYDNFSSITHGSELQPLQKEKRIDSTLLQHLCCIMQAEIQTYFQVLQQATNLDSTMKQETTKMVLQQTCNVTSLSELKSTCSLLLASS